MTRIESRGPHRIIPAVLLAALLLVLPAFGLTEKGRLDAGQRDTYTVPMQANHLYVITLDAEDEDARFVVTVRDPDGFREAAIHPDQNVEGRSDFTPRRDGHYEVTVHGALGSSAYELKITDKGAD